MAFWWILTSIFRKSGGQFALVSPTVNSVGLNNACINHACCKNSITQWPINRSIAFDGSCLWHIWTNLHVESDSLTKLLTCKTLSQRDYLYLLRAGNMGKLYKDISASEMCIDLTVGGLKDCHQFSIHVCDWLWCENEITEHTTNIVTHTVFVTI